MFGGFELILYFLLVVIVLILYAINFSEHTLPRIKVRYWKLLTCFLFIIENYEGIGDGKLGGSLNTP